MAGNVIVKDPRILGGVPVFRNTMLYGPGGWIRW